MRFVSGAFAVESVNGIADFEIVSEEGGLVYGRGVRADTGDERRKVIIAIASAERSTPALLNRLEHEYSLRAELESTWAVRPIELVRERDQSILVLENPGGELLGALLGGPMELGRFLHIALGVTAALRKVHERGLIHKDT